MNDYDASIFLKLSNKVPKSSLKRKFSVFDITNGLSEFITENFRGSAEVISDIKESGFVTISEEYFAYLIKLILKQIYGRFLLVISISFNSKTLVFNMPFEEDLKISLREQAAMYAAALNSDIEIDITPKGITLSIAASSVTSVLSIYATDMNIFKKTLYYIFF